MEDYLKGKGSPPPPPPLAICSWTATLGKILIVDNLRKRCLIVVDWRSLCKQSGENVDHLLLHCSFAQEMWSMLFGLFRVQWVIPRSVRDLFACWQGCFGHHWCLGIWRIVPHCVM